MISNKFVLLIITIININSSISSELSNSKKLEAFNTDSKERNNWLLSQNKKINSRIAKSANAQILGKLYREEYNNDYIAQTETRKSGQVFKLIDRGLGKPQELIQESIDGPIVIFSNFQLAKNNTYNALNFKLNAAADKVAIAFDFKGSIDGYKLILVDIKTKKILFKDPIISLSGSSAGAFFFKDDTLVVQTNDQTGSGLKAYPIYENKDPYFLYSKGSMKSMQGNWANILNSDSVLMISEDETISIKGINDANFLGASADYFYFSKAKSDLKHDQTQIIRIAKNDSSNQEIIVDTNENLKDISLLKKHLTARITKGSSRFVVSYNLKDPSSYKKIGMPNCCSINAVAELEGNEDRLNVTISSDLVKTKVIQWDLAKNEIIDLAKINAEMLTNSSLSIVTEFRLIKSFDGTLVPIRMVYKKGLVLKNVPIYIETYGGFNVAGYLNPAFNNFNINFINHNGLYVGTGVRGGNEFGEKWHAAATLKNKSKTFEDIASIAKSFIDSGISNKEKIIIAGSSNGGLTVAATGLLYPQYFGLVIPHNGVLDLLAKEVLDPNFGFGWSYEYGDSRKETDYKYLKLISPTEIVNNLSNTIYSPRFLVLNAKNDTRVNLAHSIKFTMAMSAITGTKIEMISLNNSGHFNTSLRYNDYVGWRAQVIKWSTIYDFLGINL